MGKSFCTVAYDGLMAHGIFGAEFLNDNKRALLESGEMYFLYLNTGELSSLSADKKELDVLAFYGVGLRQ